MAAWRQRKNCQANNRNTKSRLRNNRIKNRAAQEVYTRANSARIARNSHHIWTRNKNSTKAEENNTPRRCRSNASDVSAGFSGHSSSPFSTGTTVNPLFRVAKAIKSFSSSAVGLFSPSTTPNEMSSNRNEISNGQRGRIVRRKKQQTSIPITSPETRISSNSLVVSGGTITGGFNSSRTFSSTVFSGCIFRSAINITYSSGRSTVCIGDNRASTNLTWHPSNPPSTGTVRTYSSSSSGSSCSTVFSNCIFEYTNTSVNFGDRDSSRASTHQTRRPSDRPSARARPTNSSSNISAPFRGMATPAIAPACSSTGNRCDTALTRPKEEPGAQETDSDGVNYLYSVDKSAENRLVEEVTLGEGYEVARLEQNNQTSDRRSDISGQASTSRKRKSTSPTSNAKKQNSSTARCTLCSTDFSSLEDRNESMYSVNCGHVFCHPCLRNMGNQRHCDICNKTILSFCKLFM